MADVPKGNGPASEGDVVDPDATHLIHKSTDGKAGKITREITVAPGEQLRVPLGTYTADNPAKGFSVEFDPAPRPKNSAVTHIISLGTIQKYRLVLDIANFGSTPITAIVTEL